MMVYLLPKQLALINLIKYSILFKLQFDRVHALYTLGRRQFCIVLRGMMNAFNEATLNTTIIAQNGSVGQSARKDS